MGFTLIYISVRSQPYSLCWWKCWLPFQSFSDRMIFLSALEAWSDPPTSSQKESSHGMHFFPNVKFPMNPSKSFLAVMKLGKKVHRRTRASRWSSRKTCLGQLAQPAQASQEASEFKVFSPATCSFYLVVISMFGIKLVVTLSNMLRFDFAHSNLMSWWMPSWKLVLG